MKWIELKKPLNKIIVKWLDVRPEGFEPSTPGAEIRYSIQLNYGRINEYFLPKIKRISN